MTIKPTTSLGDVGETPAQVQERIGGMLRRHDARDKEIDESFARCMTQIAEMQTTMRHLIERLEQEQPPRCDCSLCLKAPWLHEGTHKPKGRGRKDSVLR